LSAAVLVAAASLSVRGASEVELPLLGQVLPAMCHWKRLTGLDCPGCGLTRCFIALAHGDIAAAWRFNPAGILLFAMVAGQIPYRGLQLWRLARGRDELAPGRLVGVFIAVLVGLLLLQWVWKLAGVAMSWSV
jgi:hypothetical protein